MTEPRTAVYRGATRLEVERDYHAGARAAVAEGYVPSSEDWSPALGELVLTVGYVYAPDQAPAVLDALAEAEQESRRAAPAARPTDPAPTAPTPAPVAPATPGPRRLQFILAGLGVVLLVLAWQGRTLSSFVAASRSANTAPPVGSIWFGSAFDPTTLALSGQTTSIPLGTQVAFVARLTRASRGETVGLQLEIAGLAASWPGGTVPAGDDLLGEVLPAAETSQAGPLSVRVVDLAGNTLASGTVTISH